MKIITFMLLCCLSVTVNAGAYFDVCEDARKAERQYARTMPIVIDGSTTLINFIVNCEKKLIIHEKQITVNPKTIPRPLLIKVFNSFAIRQCTVGYARYGWDITEKYYDINMKLAFIFEAKPKNCTKLEINDI